MLSRMTVTEIIALFERHPKIGTMSELARLLPAPTSTVSSWKEFNQVPHWRKPRLLGLAAELGISLSATDFPAPDERIARDRAAA